MTRGKDAFRLVDKITRKNYLTDYRYYFLLKNSRAKPEYDPSGLQIEKDCDGMERNERLSADD